MKHSCPPLSPVEPTPMCVPAPYLFQVIVAEHDYTTVHPNGCGDMQPDGTAASTIYIDSDAFPSNPYEANLYSFPLSGFPTALAVTPSSTPLLTLMA